MKKRVTYRPSKAEGAFGVVWGGIFVLIGLFVAIPTFGPFGILWTLAALAITGMNAYQAFGKNYAGPEIHIEEDGGAAPSTTPVGGSQASSPATDAKQRLEQLETLRKADLITPQEYEEKRREIMERL